MAQWLSSSSGTGKLAVREVKCPSRGHTASEWEKQILNFVLYSEAVGVSGRRAVLVPRLLASAPGQLLASAPGPLL